MAYVFAKVRNLIFFELPNYIEKINLFGCSKRTNKQDFNFCRVHFYAWFSYPASTNKCFPSAAWVANSSHLLFIKFSAWPFIHLN